jgi:hypothetical protein
LSPRSEAVRVLRSIPGSASATRSQTPAEHDPIQHAERLFGAVAHMVLVNDHGPAVSFMGWRVGTGRAESRDQSGARTIEIEILFAESGEYAVCERVSNQLADMSHPHLDARVRVLPSARDLRRFAEASTADPMRDMALASALDHSTRVWPWLRRPRKVTSYTIPFAL